MSTLLRKVIGAHAYFFRDGAAYTIPSAGNAGRNTKPGAADTGWIDMGEGDYGVSPQSKEVEFWAPSPGARTLKDIITTHRGLKLKAKVFEMQNLTWEAIFGSAMIPTSPTAGGQYNPLAGTHRKKGWLKLQQYDETNTLINTVDLYVSMKVASDVQFGEQPVDVEFEIDVLFSIYNTGTLA